MQHGILFFFFLLVNGSIGTSCSKKHQPDIFSKPASDQEIPKTNGGQSEELSFSEQTTNAILEEAETDPPSALDSLEEVGSSSIRIFNQKEEEKSAPPPSSFSSLSSFSSSSFSAPLFSLSSSSSSIQNSHPPGLSDSSSVRGVGTVEVQREQQPNVKREWKEREEEKEEHKKNAKKLFPTVDILSNLLNIPKEIAHIIFDFNYSHSEINRYLRDLQASVYNLNRELDEGEPSQDPLEFLFNSTEFEFVVGSIEFAFKERFLLDNFPGSNTLREAIEHFLVENLQGDQPPRLRDVIHHLLLSSLDDDEEEVEAYLRRCLERHAIQKNDLLAQCLVARGYAHGWYGFKKNPERLEGMKGSRWELIRKYINDVDDESPHDEYPQDLAEAMTLARDAYDLYHGYFRHHQSVITPSLNLIECLLNDVEIDVPEMPSPPGSPDG